MDFMHALICLESIHFKSVVICFCFALLTDIRYQFSLSVYLKEDSFVR